MYQLIITPQAQKELKIIKKSYSQPISLAFQEIKENPTIGKLLSKGLSGRFSYKIGSYRIIYNRFAKTPGFQTGDAGEVSEACDDFVVLRFQDSAALSGEALESLKYEQNSFAREKTADSQSAEAYKIDQKDKTIRILTAGHRSSIYK